MSGSKPMRKFAVTTAASVHFIFSIIFFILGHICLKIQSNRDEKKEKKEQKEQKYRKYFVVLSFADDQ